MTAALPTPSDHDQEHTARLAADWAFTALNPDFEVHHDVGDVARQAMAQLTEQLLANGLEVQLAELRENVQELDAERAAVIAQRAGLAHERAAEEAFTTLNPDFGVLADRYDPDQQHFAHQREAALALGTRVAAAGMQEHHPDRQQRQAAITARPRSAARPGRGDRRQARQDRPPSPAQRRAERPQRRSSDRRPRTEREEDRSR